jgi:hypothetical protein
MVVVPTRQATQPGGIGSLESILGLLKSLTIRAQNSLLENSDEITREKGSRDEYFVETCNLSVNSVCNPTQESLRYSSKESNGCSGNYVTVIIGEK